MGAGKTAVGLALASSIGVEMLDSDTELERAADRSIGEIFERDGEAFFRERETEVLLRLLTGPPCVLSTGGGVFLTKQNRDAISKLGVSVWLKADIELLWSRVKHKNTRPLLRTKNPYKTLCDLYETREQSYRLADLTVDARAEYAIEEMSEKVMHALLERPEILEEYDD